MFACGPADPAQFHLQAGDTFNLTQQFKLVQGGTDGGPAALHLGGKAATVDGKLLCDRCLPEVARMSGRERTRDYTFTGEVDVPELRQPRVPELKWVSRKAILPGEAELKSRNSVPGLI